MIKIKSSLPTWLKDYASISGNLGTYDGIVFAPDEFWWSLLTFCCPFIFEDYSIALHPFWINYKNDMIADQSVNPSEENIEHKPVSWPNFFNIYNKEFDLRSALETQEIIREELLKTKWPKHIYFPAEGDIENNQLLSVRNILLDLYGDIEVNFYYTILKTTDWFGDEITYRGKLSEIEILWSQKDLRDNPSAIFPDSKEWCIITNYDSQVTYIAGKKVFIDRLTALQSLDIYRIIPKTNQT